MRDRASLMIVLVGVALCAPGCVVQEIHDELARANESIKRVETGLTQTNQTVADVENHLDAVDETNRHLAETREQLKVLESIDGSLKSIDGSLKRLDEHLASLRKTISNIDSTIPFLKLSGDKDEPNADPAAPTQPPPPAAAPAEAPK